jgi:hypothetical protein
MNSVFNNLPIKVLCPKCGKPAPWVENKAKYGKNFGKSYMCYFCKPCGTYVGCHNNTRRPLGSMADQETLQWRNKAHLAFDNLWRSKGKKARKRWYGKLSKSFGREMHIGDADAETCQAIIQWVEENE